MKNIIFPIILLFIVSCQKPEEHEALQSYLYGTGAFKSSNDSIYRYNPYTENIEKFQKGFSAYKKCTEHTGGWYSFGFNNGYGYFMYENTNGMTYYTPNDQIYIDQSGKILGLDDKGKLYAFDGKMYIYENNQWNLHLYEQRTPNGMYLDQVMTADNEVYLLYTPEGPWAGADTSRVNLLKFSYANGYQQLVELPYFEDGKLFYVNNNLYIYNETDKRIYLFDGNAISGIDVGNNTFILDYLKDIDISDNGIAILCYNEGSKLYLGNTPQFNTELEAYISEPGDMYTKFGETSEVMSGIFYDQYGNLFLRTSNYINEENAGYKTFLINPDGIGF